MQVKMIYTRNSIFKYAVFGAVLLTFQFTVTLADPPTDADCVDSDPFPDPDDCLWYYQCFDIPGTGWVVVHLDCPPGGYYDDASKQCVPGDCSETTATEPTTTTIPTTVETTSVTTPASSASTTSSSTTTTSGPPVFTCPTAGFYPHPTDPRKYYQCVLIGGRFYYYIYTCPLEACFQQSTRTCVIGSCPNATAADFPSVTSATTIATTPEYPCPNEGYFSDPVECDSYYRCILIRGQMYRYAFHCPVGGYWNQAQQNCILGTCPA